MDPTDVIKFGKKVNYEYKLTSTQVMEEHLKQMREKFLETKSVNEQKRKQEIDFLNQLKQLDELEQMRKTTSQNASAQDFVTINSQLKQF